MDITQTVPIVTHAIQASVAPVFLLTGVGSLLGVLANRLGRVVDRHRVLEVKPDDQIPLFSAEMTVLEHRARLIHQAIRYCTLCALLICVVIAILFVGVELNKDLSPFVACLFVGGMLSLIMGLFCFLREISLATARIERRGRQPTLSG
ncbi:DUF2721 domain-containing protein [Zoogloea sp.]|uniref:DUF2721 domain-containing protein n=1 Tax=Zoogloea sp. TaxID=49181 RepID=UPI0035ADEEB8|nr:DUF2721 domain-containing protein [Rhodocyclales bacterium]